jgi:hypothetical protein
MPIILSDHNCEGHAQEIIFALNRTGLDELATIQLMLFSDIGLPFNTDDEVVGGGQFYE